MACAELPVGLYRHSYISDKSGFFYLHISLHCMEKIGAKKGRMGQDRCASELIKQMQS